jgi:heat shock protein HtpX
MTDSASFPSPSVEDEQRARRSLPYNVTYTNLIRSNKRKSAWLMIGMGMVLVVLGSALGGFMGVFGGVESLPELWWSIGLGAIASAVVASIASAFSYFGGADAILSAANAHELQREQDVQLFNVIEELSIAAGIPMPKVYVIDDPALNAFATGRNPEHGVVAITTGLRQHLTRDELAGVMAHELSHVRYYDIRFAMLMATLVGLIVFACDAFWRTLRHVRWQGGGGGSRGRGGGGAEGIAFLVVMAVTVVLALLAPFVAMLIRFAVSREREYLADAGAIELTRYPQGLISALEKLGSSPLPVRAVNRATAHLYIVNPFRSAVRTHHEFSTAFHTHPPLHKRIERLRALIE